MVVIVLVHLLIQLHPISTADTALLKTTHQIQDRHLHHTLVKVGCPVLDDLYSNHLLCLEVLTFHHLSECALTQHIKDQITILVARFLRAEDIVDIEDVVAILVVITIILDALAWFREDATWIARGLVVEATVAQLVRHGKVCC